MHWLMPSEDLTSAAWKQAWSRTKSRISFRININGYNQPKQLVKVVVNYIIIITV